MRAALLCTVFTALPATGQAAVAIDSVTSTTTAAGSATWSHTVGTGANRLLIVGIAIKNSQTVTSVTYGGVALTQATALANTGRLEVWRLVAPASGTANIVVTFAAGTGAAIGAVSFTGVD